MVEPGGSGVSAGDGMARAGSDGMEWHEGLCEKFSFVSVVMPCPVSEMLDLFSVGRIANMY